MTPPGTGYAAPAVAGRDVSASASARLGGVSAIPRRPRSAVFSKRLPRLACALAFVLSDCSSFLITIGCVVALIRHAGGWVVLAADPVSDISRHAGLPHASLMLVGVLLYCARHGHYWRRVPFWSELRDLLIASVGAMLCVGFFEYSVQRYDSRLFLVLCWMLFPVVTLLARRGTRCGLAAASLWRLSVVVVGNGEVADQACSALLSEPRLGYRVVSVVSPADLAGSQEGRQGAACWTRVLEQHDAHLLVLALDTNDADARALTESMVRARVPFAAMPRLEGLPVLGFEQTRFFSHDTVMFSYRNNLAQPLARLAKVLFDLVAASLLLLLAAPVLLAIAVAVKLDGGPVLFAHRRLGANGREFPCFKFRSMVVDSDLALRRTLAADPQAAAEWANSFKLRRDPRVTWIGRLLRATSLDELPQLLNVLRLEMSLVGPRPIVRSEINRYGENITYYFEARPGVTGLWQVSGRSDISYAQRVQLDTWYVKNWTMWHDVAILAKTIPAVLKRQGAV